MIITGKIEAKDYGVRPTKPILQNATRKRAFYKCFILVGYRALVPLLLLGPPIFPNYLLFLSTTLLIVMIGISLHTQQPPTSQSQGS
jgi:hypothetical protein